MAVKIGFVGCGGIAQHHMRNLQNVKSAKLVAYTDVDQDKAKAVATEFGGRAYKSHKSMYDSAKLNAVYVCVPPYAHPDQEILAAEAGLALFVEKPVALSMEKAREIAAAIKQVGVVNSVGYHFRYMPAVQIARKEVKAAEVGMMHGYWEGGMPIVPWWRVMAQSGGQMVEQTTHIVDLARYLGGEVETVYAGYALRAMGEVPGTDVPDVGTAVLQFNSGAIGTISNACLTGGAFGRISMEILMHNKFVEVSPGQVTIRTPEGSTTRTLEANGSMIEDEIFVKAVAAKRQRGILSSYADAVKSLAVSLAANRSAATGEPVRVADL